MKEFDYKGWTLYDAIDGLMAYDLGATDSGVKDENMKEAVRAYLTELSKEDLKEVISDYVEDMLDEKDYTLDDVVELHEWLKSEMYIWI